jgi:hypothetical protein
MLENKGRFSANTELFPLKIPNKFMGCPITVSTLGIPSFLPLVDSHTQKSGNTKVSERDFLSEYFRLSAEKMNLTVNYLPLAFGDMLDSHVIELNTLMEGVSDVAVGLIPLVSITALPGLVHTISYIFINVKICVPCPTRVHRMDKITSMFTLPVWLTLVLVLILKGAVFWSSGNITHNSVHTTTSLPLSLYNAWAILMGVSVSKLPETRKHRNLFLLYAFYCVAIVTVFQAFFVSYLVEPSYQKQIETFDKLVDSELLYGFSSAIEMIAQTVDFTDHLKIPESRRVKCDDLVQCTRRMFVRRDIMTACSPNISHYIATLVGAEDGSKVVCYLDDGIFDLSCAALVNKGSPFLDRLNTLIRRCLEGGLVDKYWSELIMLSLLRNKEEIPEDSNDLYFVFTISHLSTAFDIFILEHFLTFAVFL